jgi:cell wall assembly regulator SMI1
MISTVEPDRACNEDDLKAAESALGQPIPIPLRGLFTTANGRYRSDGEWWVVWPLERVVEVNVEAWRQATLPRRLLAFGDDGTGNPFCIAVTGEDEVVRWSWIDGDVERMEGAVADFLAEWVPGGCR